jgi:hypothetical protein
MSQTASFCLAKAWRDVDKFRPLTEAEHDLLTGLLHGWMDHVGAMRQVDAAVHEVAADLPADTWPMGGKPRKA